MTWCRYNTEVRCYVVHKYPELFQAHTRCLTCENFKPEWHCSRCGWLYKGKCLMSDSDKWLHCKIEVSRPENVAAREVKEVIKRFYDEGSRN